MLPVIGLGTIYLHHRRLQREIAPACWVTVALWLVTDFSASEPIMQATVVSYGMIPSVLFGTASLSPELQGIPPALTLVTSLFLHAGFLHLAGNMAFLWVFGDNVEDAMGSLRFVLFYLACGACAAGAHAFMLPQSQQPLIGASGAVAGVVAAYVMLHPRVYLWGLFLNRIPLRLRASWAIGFWIMFQIVMALFSASGAVAWWAHVGGLIAGAALTPLVIARGVRLFGKEDEGGPA